MEISEFRILPEAATMTDETVNRRRDQQSFQLETIHEFHPQISAILNITPDHLNRHHTMECYIQTKEAITTNRLLAARRWQSKAVSTRKQQSREISRHASAEFSLDRTPIPRYEKKKPHRKSAASWQAWMKRMPVRRPNSSKAALRFKAKSEKVAKILLLESSK